MRKAQVATYYCLTSVCSVSLLNYCAYRLVSTYSIVLRRKWQVSALSCSLCVDRRDPQARRIWPSLYPSTECSSPYTAHSTITEAYIVSLLHLVKQQTDLVSVSLVLGTIVDQRNGTTYYDRDSSLILINFISLFEPVSEHQIIE